MRTSEFDYNLPKGFIAQNPVKPRDHSKLMVYDTAEDKVLHGRFLNLVNFLREGDVLVLNRSMVIPARIRFKIEGAEKEVFILRKLKDGRYETLVKPGKYFKVGREFVLSENISGVVVEVGDDGGRVMEFMVSDGSDLDEGLAEFGQMPLPPYITESQADFSQYQAVYAKEKGSVAAPTAGLHFTEGLLSDLREKGVQIEEVVLHVGRGTFLPVTTENVAEHVMHEEFYSIFEEAATGLNSALKEGRRIIAVGTTSVRVLESAYDEGFQAGSAGTDIFIYPGKYQWKVVGALITNFHLPKSTLIMLVASFLESKGVEEPVKRILELYELAKAEEYRFYSFGDAMLIF